MFTQIVVLYMAYMFGLPLWCRVLLWLGIAVKFVSFCIECYNKGAESRNN